MSLEHLLPDSRAIASLSNDERIAWIRHDRWIEYPRAADIVKRLSMLISYPRRPRMPCLLLHGAPGMGKTTIVNRVLYDYASSAGQASVKARPVIAIQMPPAPGEKDFYDELLRGMGSIAIPSNGYRPLDRIRTVASQIGLHVLIIDEIHNMLAGSARQQRIVLNALRFIANDLQIALVCVGTEEAAFALQTDQQLQDRFDAVDLPPWKDGADFAQLMKAFGASLPLQKQSPLSQPDYRKRILNLTEGVTVRICRVIESAAVSAIENGTERIELEMLSDDLITFSLFSVSGHAKRRAARR